MQTWRTTLVRGLMHWVQDNERCNRDPSQAHILTHHMLQAALDRNEARKRAISRQSTISADTAPPLYKPNDDFYRWAEMLFNHLNTILGVRGIPLSYVIRANPWPQYDYTDPIDLQFIKLAPCNGESFRHDAATVHNIIVGKTSPEVASWLRTNTSLSDGRADMQSLFNIYTGYGNRAARLAQAIATRDSLHYRDEKLLPFTKFLHSAQQMFEIFYEQGQGYNDEQKCRFLIDKCKPCSYLQTEISQLKHKQHDGTLSYPYIISYFTSAISDRQASYRANRTSDHKVSELSIEATAIPETCTHAEATKQYSHTEWYKITWPKRQAILAMRKTLGIANTPARKNPRTRKASEITTAVDTTPTTSVPTVEDMAAFERVVKRLSTQPTASAATTVTSNTSSTISSVAGNSFGGRHEASNSKTRLSPVSSIDRRMVGQVRHDSVPTPKIPIVGNIEMDSHADTCVLGKNFIVLNYTNRVTDVYGYSKELGAIRDIPIVTGATAIDDPNTGETIILIVNEALWYGDRLP